MRWREEILREADETIAALQSESLSVSDLADRAAAETERSIELRARDRQRKLLGKIDAALRRIADGTYGYCEEIDEPIELKRLEARPMQPCRSTRRSGMSARSAATARIDRGAVARTAAGCPSPASPGAAAARR